MLGYLHEQSKACCMYTPLCVSNRFESGSSKQGLISKKVAGFFDLLKAKFLPYVKLGAVLGTEL